MRASEREIQREPLERVRPSSTACAAQVVVGESFLVVLFRHVCIDWLLGLIIPYNLSAATSGLNLWESLDPTPNRPKERGLHHDRSIGGWGDDDDGATSYASR